MNFRTTTDNPEKFHGIITMVALGQTGRPRTAKRAIEQVEQRLSKDEWPEYYDGKAGRYVRKQARKYQTWSISGYLIKRATESAEGCVKLWPGFSLYVRSPAKSWTAVAQISPAFFLGKTASTWHPRA
ncbi:diacylglycerol kinase1 [Prunus dulcis]|uniref:Diacylglycerol kinase1 n=1 Tax=Prunus dulcis TaxID=3755 RepID=A0A4Y1RW21_PRUDU|nr:diacylglycerol kinase1 [Prunus dulcis]